MTKITAEVLLPTRNLTEDIGFFTKVLRFRMEMIYPADDPAVAVFSGHGLRVRLDRNLDMPPGTVRLLCEDPQELAKGQTALNSPGGTRIEIEARDKPLVLPDTMHGFVVRRLADQAPWVIGRAGMHYRDLIPDRLGGSIIASHIRIPDGGPVPDMVHYHDVGFQLIYCYRGWVDLVYEDQGPPFRLHAGNCVIQPPKIRHRVLFASDNIEVIEIGVPAEHVTTIDHEMELPTGMAKPDRLFAGQRFVHHKAHEAEWRPFRLSGYEARDTTICDNTQGVAGVQVARPDGKTSGWVRHDGDILFTFVLDGAFTLEGEGRDPHRLTSGDAFVIPPGMATRYADPTADLALLEVALPGQFETAEVAANAQRV
ncbi:MAG: cupin domain-containing protein [Pseudomonadota bacterium]